MKIIIASSNKGKLKEFKELLNGYDLFLASDFVDNFNPIEDGNSFKQNAKIKALALWNSLDENLKKEYVVLSDDSGLSVEALNKAPGIYSARYGDDFSGNFANKDARNRAKLKFELEKLGINSSKASFICVLCLVTNDKIEFAKGICDGMIYSEESGKNGFGFDSMFVPNGYDKTFAEFSEHEKNQISHRANALKEIKKILALLK